MTAANFSVNGHFFNFLDHQLKVGDKITPQNRIKRNLQKIGAIKFSSKWFFFSARRRYLSVQKLTILVELKRKLMIKSYSWVKLKCMKEHLPSSSKQAMVLFQSWGTLCSLIDQIENGTSTRAISTLASAPLVVRTL